jgi:hypothetical protein
MYHAVTLLTKQPNLKLKTQYKQLLGVQKLMVENLKVVWAKFSTISHLFCFQLSALYAYSHF